MNNLWSLNTPENFWGCQTTWPKSIWSQAVKQSAHLLGLPSSTEDLDELLSATLGEGQFGPDHWQMSRKKRLYYAVKPLLPRFVIRWLRRYYTRFGQVKARLNWPIEDRYVRFLWQVLQQSSQMAGETSVSFSPFWPEDKQFAFVLTHDIETAAGQDFVRQVAEIDARYGFRSSFNFVPERYPLDSALMAELRAKGFEIGVHGLKHDGKLYRSYDEFMRRADRINHYLKAFGAVGFRAPYTHRQPEWMQALQIDYDLSFFDTDPFEPIPGGTMSIWPFIFGHIVELPYTLVQDNTLTNVLGETSPRIWLQKVAFIRQYHGLALINTHPDYLRDNRTLHVYEMFLEKMHNQDGYWHALPRDVAHWWRVRMCDIESGSPAQQKTNHDQGNASKPDEAPVSTG